MTGADRSEASVDRGLLLKLVRMLLLWHSASFRLFASALLVVATAFVLAPPVAADGPSAGTFTYDDPVGVAQPVSPELARPDRSVVDLSVSIAGRNGGLGHVNGSITIGVAPTSAGRIPWTSFDDYPKVTIGGRQYADVGGRPYTQHAVDRMQPSGLGSSGMPGGASGPGRSISPNYVDDVLTSDLTVTKPVTGPLGQARTSHVSGSVEVITEGDIVITIITR